MSATRPSTPLATFWFDFEVPYAKLLCGRVLLFGLLALDALMQLRHAPRYGSGFNVAQLPFLDAIGPGRVGYGLGQLVEAYVFVLIACGVATRWLVPVGAAVYAWLYFGSQLDSYQHHYFVAMVLLLACFVPWQRQATLATQVKSWALRLILAELAILYLWAAISKLDAHWLDGLALSTQIHGSLRTLIDATIGIKAVAILVPLTELALAFVWLRPAWRVLAPLGIAFHLGIVWSGLEIGLFAWLMIGSYAFVLPDGVYLWLARRVPRIAWPVPAVWIAYPVSMFAGLVLAMIVRFPGSLAVAIVASTVSIGAMIFGGRRAATVIALPHLLAIAVWLVVDRGSTITHDYYKFWAGTSRRLDDPSAIEASRGYADIAPDDANARYAYGRALLDRDDPAGLDEFHAAEQLDRKRARAYLAEARWLATKGRQAEALVAARAATAAEPTDNDARALLATLEQGLGR